MVWISCLKQICWLMDPPLFKCRSICIFIWIGMWNRLVTPPIDDREGMDGGGEVTSTKEENGGRIGFPWHL